MKLTLVERLMLANQYTILEHLNPRESEHYNRVRRAIEQGFANEYDQALGWINKSEMHERDATFVLEVLGMFVSLGHAYEDAADKTEFKNGKPAFLGFDEQNEPEFFSYATFLIGQPARYDNLKSSRGYNSHHRVTQKYVEMLIRYEHSADKTCLTPDDVNRIMTLEYIDNSSDTPAST